MTVHVDAGGQPVTVLRHVGLLQIQAPPPASPGEQAFVGDLRGFGLFATPAGITLGYTRERWAIMGSQCRAVLWMDEHGHLDEALRKQLAQINGLCLLAPPPDPQQPPPQPPKEVK